MAEQMRKGDIKEVAFSRSPRDIESSGFNPKIRSVINSGFFIILQPRLVDKPDLWKEGKGF
jgi:hypothetical protein